MKARIMNKTIEIPEDRLAKGGMEGHAGEIPRRNVVGIPRTPVGGTPTHSDQPASSPAPSPLPGWPKPTDKWNWAYAQYLELEKRYGRVAYWIYEPWSMWLPGGIRYKPDFLVVYPEGLEQKPKLVEVKGWSRNLRDGKTRYAIAAALFPCFEWAMVKRKRHGWEEYS